MDDPSFTREPLSTPKPVPRRPIWRRLWSPLGALISAALVLALVAGLAFLFASRGGNGTALPSAQPTPTVPPHWRVYHAPNNAFSMAIPNTWTANVSTSEVTSSYQGVSDDYTMTMIALSGKDSITVDITMSPIQSSLEHRLACQNRNHQYTNTKVAGLPALYLPQAGWLFDTNTMYFQIGYFYPGYTGDILQTKPPTPIPTAEYNLGQKEINTIIASFRPNPDTPLKC